MTDDPTKLLQGAGVLGFIATLVYAIFRHLSVQGALDAREKRINERMDRRMDDMDAKLAACQAAHEAEICHRREVQNQLGALQLQLTRIELAVSQHLSREDLDAIFAPLREQPLT